MKPALLVCLLLLLATNALAHRLDEYLQATRIALATNRIDLFLELTPGVAIVDQLLAVIDKNRDGKISKEEGTAYAQNVLKDMQLRLNEKALAMTLTGASYPTMLEIKAGVGVIHINVTSTAGRLSEGHHALTLTNAHMPAISVYLVNALAPKDPIVKISKQARDEFQKNYRLEFRVDSATP